MTVRSKEYHRPEDWSRAHQLLSRSEVHTVPLVVSPRPAALTDLEVDAFVDLQKLQLDAIQKSGDNRIHLGGMATLQAVYESELLKAEAGGILSEAAHISATLGIRNLATVAGALTAPSGPPDVALALMALDAAVTVQKAEGQTRSLRLHEFIAAGQKALQRGEVLVEVSFASAPSFASLARVGRTPRDHAIVAAAAVVEVANGAVRRAGVALAGANPLPVRLLDVEKLLAGKALSAALLDQAAAMAEKQAAPQGDYRGSVEYRRAMAAVLVRRALAMASKQAGLA